VYAVPIIIAVRLYRSRSHDKIILGCGGIACTGTLDKMLAKNI